MTAGDRPSRGRGALVVQTWKARDMTPEEVDEEDRAAASVGRSAVVLSFQAVHLLLQLRDPRELCLKVPLNVLGEISACCLNVAPKFIDDLIMFVQQLDYIVELCPCDRLSSIVEQTVAIVPKWLHRRNALPRHCSGPVIQFHARGGESTVAVERSEVIHSIPEYWQPAQRNPTINDGLARCVIAIRTWRIRADPIGAERVVRCILIDGRARPI